MRAMTAALGVVIAVAGAEAAAAASDPVARVIVRFRPDVADPVDAAALATLARLADVPRIDLLRPMSGASYVLILQCGARGPVDDDPCAAAIARLAAVDTVVAVEVDGRLRHQ